MQLKKLYEGYTIFFKSDWNNNMHQMRVNRYWPSTIILSNIKYGKSLECDALIIPK